MTGTFQSSTPVLVSPKRPQHKPPKRGTDYTLLHFYEENTGGLSCTARIYEGDINITGGGGGWVSVQRPQRSPATSWRGATDAYTIEVPLIFDVFGQDDADVENSCRTLEIMSGTLTSAYVQPPILILNANGALPNDVFNFPPLRWVIPDEPVWGEQLRNSQGRRVRQCVTVKFMKYTAPDALHRSNPATPIESQRSTIAKAGDTYNKIAARELKQYGGTRWGNRLALLNGARDGASKPLPGRVVKLPTVAQIKSWEKTPRR